MTHRELDDDDSDQVKRASPDAPVLTAEEARQGRRGKPVFWILIVSTSLAMLGVLGALGFFW